MDKLIHGIAADGTIRLMAAITTETVEEAIRRHKTTPTASAALGRTLTGTLLLGSSLKDYDRLTVKIEAKGDIGGIVAEATPDGKVRGYVRNPIAVSPIKNNGKLDVSGIVGEGMFYVIRESGFDVGLYKEPYIGSVPIISGEIAEDFAYYLLKSEQIPSAVLLGVLLKNESPFVTASGGVMIQMMPGANEHIITIIEDNIKHAPHLTSVIKEGATPKDLLKMALGEIPFEVFEEKDVSFKCNCSMEKAVSIISSLGKNEVEDMLEKDRKAVMDCGFCNEKYELSEDDLREIILNSTV
ncbi:MAG: Hsp33 family molecular chaperone HslO [Acidobacteriota bacterium]|nr:Hsp33 family molecular chaperone HslO [Acidobacteriota bacterium]